jgi:two-component system OmpR family response regulator
VERVAEPELHRGFGTPHHLFEGREITHAVARALHAYLRRRPPQRSLREVGRRDSVGLMETPRDARRVLVVDDEPSLVDAVSTALRYEGFDVVEATTGRAGLAAAQDVRPDLIVLDVMLPDLDGFAVSARLREDGITSPVLFLTARDSLEDKAQGFAAGADDYLTKPFSLAELVMRVKAILRRSAGGNATDDAHVLRFADVELDVDAHQCQRGGVTIDLTATEFSLLEFFLQNPGRVLSKAQILDHVWHYDFGGDSNICETYVSYLRKKLNAHGPALLHTVRLVGYVLRDPVSAR